MEPNQHTCRTLHDSDSGMYCFLVSNEYGQPVAISQPEFVSVESATAAGCQIAKELSEASGDSNDTLPDAYRTDGNVIGIKSKNPVSTVAISEFRTRKKLAKRILDQYSTPLEFDQDILEKHAEIVGAYRKITMSLAASLAGMYSKHPQDKPENL